MTIEEAFAAAQRYHQFELDRTPGEEVLATGKLVVTCCIRVAVVPSRVHRGSATYRPSPAATASTGGSSGSAFQTGNSAGRPAAGQLYDEMERVPARRWRVGVPWRRSFTGGIIDVSRSSCPATGRPARRRERSVGPYVTAASRARCRRRRPPPGTGTSVQARTRRNGRRGRCAASRRSTRSALFGGGRRLPRRCRARSREIVG